MCLDGSLVPAAKMACCVAGNHECGDSIDEMSCCQTSPSHGQPVIVAPVKDSIAKQLTLVDLGPAPLVSTAAMQVPVASTMLFWNSARAPDPTLPQLATTRLRL
jgi:hypothetical protein